MIHFDYQPQDRFILTIFSGDVSGKEMEEHFQNLLSIENDSGHIRGLTVLGSSLRLRAFESLQMIRLARSLNDAKFLWNSQNALVAFTPMSYRLAKVNEFVANMRRIDETMVFRGADLQSAISWLELSAKTEEIIATIQEYEELVETQ